MPDLIYVSSQGSRIHNIGNTWKKCFEQELNQ